MWNIENSDDFLNYEQDGDDNFILDVLNTIPRIRIYHERPNLFEDYNDKEFRLRYRFSKENVLRLNDVLFDRLTPSTNRSKSLSSMCQLLIGLRFLATGCFQMTEGDLFRCSQSTISRKIPGILASIAELGNSHQIIKMPQTESEILDAKLSFSEIAGFPGVIGTIDCTHIRIECPNLENGEMFRNRKSYFSINVQCVGGPNLEIMDIEARWPGSTHDQTILDASYLKLKLESNVFPRSIVLGDRGYALKKYLITPLANPQTVAEKRFQTAHLKTRNSVERLFGCWKSRFPTLSLGFRVKVRTTLLAINASAVLHNLALAFKDGVDDFEEVVDLGNYDLPPNDHDNNRNASVRDALIRDYFL